MAAKVNADVCVGCGACEGSCPMGAIKIVDGKSQIDEGACVDCGTCVGTCPVEAISL